MAGKARIAARLLAVAAATLLAGCSSIAPFQDETSARVRVGHHDAVERPVGQVAPLVVGYGLLALQTKRDELFALGPDSKPPAPTKLDTDSEFARLAAPWLRPWVLVRALVNECAAGWGNRRDFGYDGAPGSCAENDSPKGRVLDGLGVQVWTRGRPDGRFCPEIAIAFRGTDPREADDWYSNFRAVTRILHLYDQYEQVQDHIKGILDRFERLPCHRPSTRIVAVGHSLGGGLAQQAAYKDRRIRRVYAFDPSFVTGYYDLDPAKRQANEKGLRIERVYEHGEVLAYPRLVLRNLYPPSPCDPQIRNIRFNLRHGGTIISQHSLDGLLLELLKLSHGRAQAKPDESVLPVSELADAVTGACLPAGRVALAAAPGPWGGR
jgi:pimeloyl-ACP methyl ester carboxylesterase